LPVNAETELAELLGLLEKLRTLDVDDLCDGRAAEKIEKVWSVIGDRKWLEFAGD